FKRDSVMWPSVLEQVNPKYAALSQAYGTPSSFSWPGNIDRVAIPTADCIGPMVGQTCFYDRYSRFQAVPDARRVNALLQGDVKINEKTDWHTELTLSTIRVEYQNTYPTYGSNNSPTQWLDTATGLQNTFYFRSLPLTHPLIGPDGDEF